MKPVLLDLFCGAGGAAMGYQRAGFSVVGVDIEPQPNYPFEFVRADALQVLDFVLKGDAPWLGLPQPDAIHASPVCKGYSAMTDCRPGVAGGHPKLIGEIREKLSAIDLPWVIENVEGSGLAAQDDLFGTHGAMLCGAMFGLPLYRHRYFEASFPLAAPHHPRHTIPASRAGHWEPGTIISVAGHCNADLAREAMGIDWTTRDELAEAIPPAFTEFIGAQLLAHLSEVAA